MIDWTKLKIEDIKQLIIEHGLFSKEDVEGMQHKGKAQWVEFAKKVFGENKDQDIKFNFEELEGVISDMEAIVEQKIEAKRTPNYYDVEWQDYVLAQFAPNELVDGKYPSVNGLRRVVELLLGEIMQAGPIDTKTTMDPAALGKAVVTYEILIAWKLGAGPYISLDQNEPYPLKCFRAIASSCPMNTDDMYAVFPEAIAETRAEGRALRRALRLAVVCADELTRKNTAEIVKQSLAKSEKATEGNWEEASLITDNQINSIKLLCDRLGIDVNKFINSGSKKYTDIIEISRQTAANMIKRLNEYQSSSNGSVEIPVDILLEK